MSGLIEEGSLLLLTDDLLVMTREDFTANKEVISAARFGRYRYRAALTKPTSRYSKCYFDPDADVITNDGSPTITTPIASIDNVGSAIIIDAQVRSGIKTDNWAVECVALITPDVSAPVLINKNTGYTGTVDISGVYSGVTPGQITVTVIRRGDLSGVSPRCAQIEITGVVPTIQIDVVGDIPLIIGDGLSLTLGTDGVYGDWLHLGDTWIIDVTESQVGSPTPDIGNSSVVTSVTTGGTYNFGTDETYTVAVTTPGGDGVAQVTITSASGNDDIGPLTVSDGVGVPLGLRGGIITFTGITNLDDLDYWIVNCVAATSPLTQGTHATGYVGTLTAAGDFTAPLDDTYTVEIVTGGPIGVAVASITSLNGDDDEGLPITIGPLDAGQNGLTIEFAAGELAPGDQWTIDVQGERSEWEVVGTITGLVSPIAVGNIAYQSDDETIEFFILPSSIPTVVGDRFTFSSFSAAISAGVFLTSGSVQDDEMVFLLNADKSII